MIEGWWISFVFMGLSFSIGGLVYVLYRDRKRRIEAKRRRVEEIMRESLGLGEETPTVKELEALYSRQRSGKKRKEKHGGAQDASRED